jgi:Zn finger protein HypA/HybF involved in hydrogenase expression
MRVKIYCDACKSQSDVEHEMDSYQYNVEYCPLCGTKVDEDNIEELEDFDD